LTVSTPRRLTSVWWLDTLKTGVMQFPPSRWVEQKAGCHLYLWTTHKYLHDAIDIMKAWGFNYQCVLTWVKNIGFTPFSWRYSTELCLFGRCGDLDLLTNGVRLDFSADSRQHSRKPDEFYDIVRSVSPAPRIDVFSREKREGFDQYGDEQDKFDPGLVP
jgi:N6-adenosine-specific RNA methylase IME4